MTPQTVPTRCSRRRMPGTRRSLACNRTVTTSDGVSLSVRDWGSHAAGHTVVFLHGFCLNKESWNIQMTQLIRRWGNNIRIISYDHRGHGDSGNASMHTYRIDRLADDLAELLVALGVTGPLTLAGHSMGGMTALAYLRRPASKRPIEPESLVLVATAAGNLGSHGLGRLLSTPATSMLYHLVHRMPRAGTDELVQFLARPVCAARCPASPSRPLCTSPSGSSRHAVRCSRTPVCHRPTGPSTISSRGRQLHSPCAGSLPAWDG